MIATLLTLSLSAAPQSPAPLPFIDLLSQERPRVSARQLWEGITGQQLAVSVSPCGEVAQLQAAATLFDLQEEYTLGLARAANTIDPLAAAETEAAAFAEMLEGIDFALEVLEARYSVCSKTGGGVYDPVIDPSNFTDTITNPMLPYTVGSTWTYQGRNPEEVEEIVVTVLPDVREILGIDCRIVRDTVTVEGELIEDTYDYYAQDLDGSVWYFGEISFNYEDGFIVDIEGSWLAGENGAKPGIVMPAQPYVGQAFRQEYSLNEAEDAAEILSMTARASLHVGTFNNLIKTADVVPLEPGALEYKYYAHGIGFLYEVKPETGETVELIGYSIL